MNVLFLRRNPLFSVYQGQPIRFGKRFREGDERIKMLPMEKKLLFFQYIIFPGG